MKEIVTVAVNPAIDKNTSVALVVGEAKLRCSQPAFQPGGGGINVAQVIKILGESAEVFYPAGGSTGSLLKELLDQEGIERHLIPIEAWTRQNLNVTETKTHKQFRFGMPGPELTSAQWRQCLADIADLKPRPEFIVGSGSLPPGVPSDFYAQLARLGKGMDAKVIIDTSGEPLYLAAEEGCYMMKPNIKELCDLMGREFKDEIDQCRAAKKLIDAGACEVLVVSLGAGGALVVTEEGFQRFRSPTVPIHSKIGAGDSMVGGIVVGLIQGRSLEESICLGVSAGAAAVMRPGMELCRREDVEQIYEQMRTDAQPWKDLNRLQSKTA